MKVVISLGGSVIVPDKVDEKFLKEFSKLIKKSPHRFRIVCGGGKTARIYTNTSLSARERDLLGIEITKVNAKLVSFYIPGSKFVENPLDAGKEKGKVILTAGWKPGVNTDYDSALVCKTFKPDLLINISNVDGVYDKDPRRYKNAKLIKKMSYDDFLYLASKVKRKPGMNFIFDPKAMALLKKLKVKCIFVGKSISNLKNVLNGRKFKGTIVYEG